MPLFAFSLFFYDPRGVDMKKIPSLLALVWAIPGLVMSFSGAGFGPLFFILPILAVAVLLWFPTLATRIPGFILALMITLLYLLGSAEEGVFSTSDHLAPISLHFFFGLVLGVFVCLVALFSLFLASHVRRTSWPARLSFLLAAYWLGVLLADGFLSANLPTLRALTPPLLALVFFIAGFLLRRPSPLVRLSLLLATFTLLSTTVFWIAYAPLLTLNGTFPPTPGSAYFTLLPWPVLLSLSLLANLALLALLLRPYLHLPHPASHHPASTT